MSDSKPSFFSLQAHAGWIVALISALVGQGVTLIVQVGRLTEKVESLDHTLRDQKQDFQREIDQVRGSHGRGPGN